MIYPHLELLNQMVAQGYVYKKKHKHHALFLYEYAPICTFERMWNEATMDARGLVLSVTGEIIAMPFKKFFNYGELEGVGQTIPRSEFVVQEKVDGSLGICYFYHGKWRVNTKGSFESDQAIWATDWLNNNVSMEGMIPGYTYMFEIVYPENRIVVDYQGRKELVLLGVRNDDLQLVPEDQLWMIASILGVRTAEVFNYETLADLFEAQKKLTVNEEGFVVSYDNEFKFKLKGEEYCRIHSIICNMTPLAFWRAYDQEKREVSIDYLASLPEEFREYCEELREAVECVFNDLYAFVDEHYQSFIKYDAWKYPERRDRWNYLCDHYCDQSGDQTLAKLIMSRYDGKTWHIDKWARREARPTNNLLPSYLKVSDNLKMFLKRVEESNEN